MKSLAPELTAALASGRIAMAQLFRFDFPSQTLAYNTSTYTLSFGGVDYRPAVNLGSAVTITDAPGDMQCVQIELNGGPSALISLALDASDEVQGAPFTIRTAWLLREPLIVFDAPIEWTGFLDTMTINDDGQRCRIQVTAENKGVDLLRGSPVTMSDADQKALYSSTDQIFQYLMDQLDKPVVWPTREFFYR